ncbi:MAG: hypothetical protein IJY24_05755 [Clostridia bacterium]|nr:hypothetical protein [Clostridia bacterium]
MKNFKKILAVLCVLALLVVGVTVTVIASGFDEYSGTVEELNSKIAQITSDALNADTHIATAVEYLDTVDPTDEGYDEAVVSLKTEIVNRAKTHIVTARGETDLAKKVNGIKNTDALLAYIELDSSVTGYDDVMSYLSEQVVLVVKGYVDQIELKFNEETGYWNTADTTLLVNKVNSLLKAHPDELEAAGETELEAEFEQIKVDLDEKRQANKDIAEKNALIEEYNYGYLFNYDFETTPGFGSATNKGNNFADRQVIDGNGVYTIKYTNPSSNTFVQVQTPDAKSGIVCEFDWTTFDVIPGGNGFGIEGGGQNNVAGQYGYPFMFGITPQGDLFLERGKAATTTVKKDIVTPGEWIHFAYVYNHAEQMFYIYMEYELVGQHSSYTDGAAINHVQIRPNAAATYGEYSMDNFQVYKGTAIRTDGKLKNMSTDEKFVFYCDYLSDDAKTVLTRNTAYTEATKLINNYYSNGQYLTQDPVIIEAIGKYNSFDYDALLAELMRVNRDKFIELVAKYEAIERSMNSVTSRSAVSKEISEFLSTTGSNILVDADYNAANSKLQAMEKLLGCDTSASSFVTSMTRFSTAPTLVARRKHLGKATTLKNDEAYPLDRTYYDSCFDITYDDAGNEISRTPIKTYEAFIAAYESFGAANEILKEYEREDTAKKIVDIVGLISDYTTEEDWRANYDYINNYILILRKTVKDGENDDVYEDYNEDYEGLDEALAIYTPINAWFYADLQKQHIDILNEQLANIAATDSYIEKMGMCSFITRYLASNDIDETSAEIQQIVVTHQTYLNELSYREADYAALLEQNAHYFNTVMVKLTLAEDYNEIKKYYDEASVYYFALDATVEGTREYMDIYDTYTDTLTIIKESSEKFLESMVLYKATDAADKEAKFNALVTCYSYSINAELSFDGVEEAMAEFLADYNAYVGEVDTTNGELNAAAGIMASSRANSGIAPIIAAILAQLENN